MSLSIVVSLALFVLNLLIFLSVRASDRKSRSFANQNQQIKNFRSEVSATCTRILETSQDCTDNVQTHIDKARATVELVTTCLDRLSQHQKDLTALEGICVDYKRSLDKLKLQTDQAENRILVVQAEIRKAESVSDFVKSFHDEADLLEQQLQDLKAEYLRLVTSTQESLKQQAQLQRNENGEMLTQFNGAIERQKQQFVEYVNTEKQGFARECDNQTRIAAQATEMMEGGRKEVEDTVRNASASVATMRDGIRMMLDQANEEMTRFRGEVKNSFDGFRADIEKERTELEEKFGELSQRIEKEDDSLTVSFGELSGRVAREDNLLKVRFEELSGKVQKEADALRTKFDELSSLVSHEAEALELKFSDLRGKVSLENDDLGNAFTRLHGDLTDAEEKLESHVKEYTEALGVSFDDISQKMDQKKDELTAFVSDRQNDLGQAADRKSQEFSDRVKAATGEVDEKIVDLRKERDEYAEAARVRYREALTEELGKANQNYDRISKLVASQIDILSERSRDINGAVQVLSEKELTKLNDAIGRLKDLSSKISDSEKSLSELQETVTSEREALYRLQGEHESLEKELSASQAELRTAKEEIATAKEKSISMEAELGRMSLEKEKARAEE